MSAFVSNHAGCCVSYMSFLHVSVQSCLDCGELWPDSLCYYWTKTPSCVTFNKSSRTIPRVDTRGLRSNKQPSNHWRDNFCTLSQSYQTECWMLTSFFGHMSLKSTQRFLFFTDCSDPTDSVRAAETDCIFLYICFLTRLFSREALWDLCLVKSAI